MSRAIPGGRSVVTLHGPSLAWRSASARRWRTESSVQCLLRSIGECMGSASESETRVMGIPKAWAHDTTVTTRTARFTITDCTGYQVGEAGEAGALSPELGTWWGGPPRSAADAPVGLLAPCNMPTRLFRQRNEGVLARRAPRPGASAPPTRVAFPLSPRRSARTWR